jgi:hypothetical protein
VSDAADTPDDAVGGATLSAALAIEFHRPRSRQEWEALGRLLGTPGSAADPVAARDADDQPDVPRRRPSPA